MAISELLGAVTASDSTIQAKVVSDNDRAMDFGATLVVVLGSGAAVTIAKGVQNWMGRWTGASVVLSDGARQATIKNVSGAEAARLTEQFLKQVQAN